MNQWFLSLIMPARVYISNTYFSNFDYSINNDSMIYQSSPAWSMRAKNPPNKSQKTPSPDAYKPNATVGLAKCPSWKIGKQMRGKTQVSMVPAPNVYQPSFTEKSKKMGIIGHEIRAKQNTNPTPGPGSYVVQLRKSSPSISMAHKYEVANKTIDFPGPGSYMVPSSQEKRGLKLGRQKRFTAETELRSHPGPGRYEYTRPNSATISFTKAERMSLKKGSPAETIGPGQYQIKGIFDQQAAHAKGYSLGLKFEGSPPVKTPGPGDYSPSKGDLPTSPSVGISMRYREQIPNKTPSPNQYDPQYKNVACKTETYSIGKAQRMPLHDSNHIPGPGSYLKTDFQNTGIQISVGMSRRIDQKNDLPGPGAYDPKVEVVHKRPQSAKLGKSKRFQKIKTEMGPSPGDYQFTTTSFHQSPKFTFTRKKKLDSRQENVPGPGSYNLGSTISNLPSYVTK